MSVTPPRHSLQMTDDEVLDQADAEGFELEERPLRDKWVWGWCRGDDQRWPCYIERRQAIDWMRDRRNRGRIFALRCEPTQNGG